MSSIFRLNPPIYGYCPLGECAAHLVIDYGIDSNPVFLVDLFDKNRQSMCIDSNEFYFGENSMLNLDKPDEKVYKQRNI